MHRFVTLLTRTALLIAAITTFTGSFQFWRLSLPTGMNSALGFATSAMKALPSDSSNAGLVAIKYPLQSNSSLNALVADAVGITGSCTGTAGTPNVTCTYSHPVTCSGTAGANSVTVSGYTPSSADIGKVLVVGFPVFQDNGASQDPTGAGGSYGQDIRVHIGSVSGQTVTFGTGIGTSPTRLVNSVTNADCEIGTDNSSIVQNILNNGNNVVFGAGRYLFSGPAVSIPSSGSLSCQAGAVLINAKADNYDNDYFKSRMFTITSGSGQSFTGPCIFIGTNTAGAMAQDISPLNRNTNNMILENDQQSGGCLTQPCNYPSNEIIGGNIASAPMVFMFSWGDAALEFQGGNSETVHNVVSYVGWAYGAPSIIWGMGNNFSNITTLDGGIDVEPNSAAEGCATYNNNFTTITAINDGNFGYRTYPTAEQIGGANQCFACGTTCTSGQYVNDNSAQGDIVLYDGTIPWQNSGMQANDTGQPYCYPNPGGGCGTLK